MKSRLLQALAPFTAALAFALSLPAPTHAEDIDLFTAGVGTTERPNVLFVWDSSANWSANLPTGPCYYRENGVVQATGSAFYNKKMGLEQCALYNVIDALKTNTVIGDPNNDALFNVGIMMLNESGDGNGNYPRKAFIPVTTNNKAALKTLIKSFDILADKGNNADFALSLYESYLYFAGSRSEYGINGDKRDTSAFAGSNYVSPSGNSCGKNHIIFIGNGGPQSSENGTAEALLRATSGTAVQTVIPGVSVPMQKNWFDEWARYLAGKDVSNKDGVQGITTHTVAVTGAPSDGTFPAFMEATAKGAGGVYVAANNADALIAGLLDIFDQIQAVNSAFASVSLPLAVNARGTYLNQVYVGVFRPDANAKPRWPGNLKQYQLGIDGSGDVNVTDSTGASALSSTTGFFTGNAKSFWTKPSTFWTNAPSGTGGVSDLPDGEIVEKGGVAQRLRTVFGASQATRKVLTCLGGCGSGTILTSHADAQFTTSNSNITQAALGAATATERDNLINWIRGTDNNADEAGPGGTVTVRPSIHGDVIHSRPLVLNYGGTTGVVVFYGANDGFLHAIYGNQSDTNGGNELWAFTPKESLSKFRRMRNNSPAVLLPTTPVGSPATPRDYFVDGPVSAYTEMDAAGAITKAILYFGMRRGGRLIYALDVTDPNAPKYLWSKTNTELSKLGQTWSEIKAVKVKGNVNPVVVFGAGYDSTEDNTTPGATSMGNAVYALDALTGALVKEFGPITKSIPADVSLVDTDSDGFVDRAYTVDLGGMVWRLDFEDSTGDGAVANWGLSKVADLSGGTATGRKFFQRPSVVSTTAFTAILVGSGDREKPLKDNNYDHFFTVYDRKTTKGVSGLAAITFGDMSPISAGTGIDGGGCYLALDKGEKVVNSATTLLGNTYFGTNKPQPVTGNTCSANLGLAKGYKMPLYCGAPVSWEFIGGGYPPSPVATVVSIQTTPETTVKKIVCFGCGKGDGSAQPPSQSDDPPQTVNVPRKRTQWFNETRR